jgi:hypothetical protein
MQVEPVKRPAAALPRLLAGERALTFNATGDWPTGGNANRLNDEN